VKDIVLSKEHEKQKAVEARGQKGPKKTQVHL